MDPLGKRVETNGNAARSRKMQIRPGPEMQIRLVIELIGGMDWLKPGQTVLIKPSLNSGAGQFPFTASPISCSELVRMCLEHGAAKVYVANEMGFEHTMTNTGKPGSLQALIKL